ncbi:hypothetical protein HMPREF1988_00320, partial [Porphyromonas gingivalis F0185]
LHLLIFQRSQIKDCYKMFLRGRRWSLRLKNKTIVISFDFVAMGKFLKTDEIFSPVIKHQFCYIADY